MAIQVNISQPTGIIQQVNINPNNPVTSAGSTANFTLLSYLSSAAYLAGDLPITQMGVNITSLLASTWPAPSGSFVAQLITILENYIINNLAAFNGGSIVS